MNRSMVLSLLVVIGAVAFLAGRGPGTTRAATLAHRNPPPAGAAPRVMPAAAGGKFRALDPPAAPLVTLYDQVDNPSGDWISSEQFEAGYATHTDQAADDFAVPAGQGWQVNEVDAIGQYDLGGSAASFNVFFYTSVVSGSYTIPGTPVYTATAQFYVNNAHFFAVLLSSPPTLTGPATYFVSVQAVRDSGGWYWLWSDRTVQSNGPAAWRNPGDGFNYGCTDWRRRTVCPGGDPAGPDQMFRLVGSIVPPASPTATPTPTATPAVCVMLNEDFESGYGVFTSTVPTCVPGGCGWVLTSTAHSGVQAVAAPDLPNISDQQLTELNAFTVPPAATLSFWHRYNLENTFDGGVLEISTNNGITWTDVLSTGATFISGGYNGVIGTLSQSPIAGRPAWTGNPHGTNYTQVDVSLAPLAGQSIRLRFREANDFSVTAPPPAFWWVDDVRVSVAGVCPSPTATQTATPVANTPTATRTATPVANTPTATSTPTPLPPSPTHTTGPTATSPPEPSMTGTSTNVPTSVATSVATSTGTGVATGTSAPTSTATSTATNTRVATSVASATTAAGSPTATVTPCAIPFSDTLPTDYFYAPVRYLYCQGVISGYSDNTFRPYANTTRAQMVKIVTLGFGIPLAQPLAAYTFADVPPSFPFFSVIETAAAHGIVSGYACGGPSEPCDSPPRPYFRPSANVTRGQLSKIVVGAAGWPLLNPPSPSFTDVAPDSAFYAFVETAVCHGVVSGYADGTFRPGANATRGQISKIVYLALINPPGACPTARSAR